MATQYTILQWSKFVPIPTYVDQIFGATQKLKTQRRKNECLEYFCALNPSYVINI
jgi:hypothetical protein